MATSRHLIPTPDANMGMRGAQKAHTGTRPSGAQQQKSLNDLEALASSLVDSPASPLVLPGFDVEQQTSATSGQRCLELFDLRNPSGSSLRMCVASLLGTKAWYSKRYALTWKSVVTKSNRLLFQLLPSMPRTGATGSGLLPTASAQEAGLMDLETKDGQPAQPGQRAYNPKTGTHHQITLNRAVAMIPTPNAHDYRIGYQDRKGGKGQENVETVIRNQTGGKTGLKLQPNFVAWMMGFPESWAILPSPKPSTELSNSKPMETL